MGNHDKNNILEHLFLSKTFMSLWIFFVCLAALILQYTEGLSLFQGITFFSLISSCGIIQWFLNSLDDVHVLRVLVLYLFLIFLASFILPGGAFAIQIGLLPVWIAQNLILNNKISMSSHLSSFILFLLRFTKVGF